MKKITDNLGLFSLQFMSIRIWAITLFFCGFYTTMQAQCIMFTAPTDLCIDAGVQTGLGGATPLGGVYSGPGVTDSGNGSTYSFDPTTAGVGTHSLTYTYTNSLIAQLGMDIDGEAANDQSGDSVSVSADGTRVAIGGRLNDGNGSNSGHIRIFEWDGIAWNQLGMDIDGEAAADEASSVSLSADGTRVAIGGEGNDGNGINSGNVRIFEWDGVAWNQLGMDIDGEAVEDYSGYSVSLSADGIRVAIGGYANDGNGSNSGHVRIFEWDGVAWNQLGMDIDGEAADDLSGYSVSLSADGTRVAIGGFVNDGNGSNSGHVRIFEWDGVAWNQLGMDIDGEAAFDYSGWSVSLSADGSRVAIGAQLNDGNGSNSGHVRIFEWDGVAWNQLGMDIDGEAANDQSGDSVSLSADGTRVAIGAQLNDGNGSGSGHVRIFEWDGVAWNQLEMDIDGEAVEDFSSYSVSLSADGTHVAIGGPGNDGNGSFSGHVRIYKLPNGCANNISDDIEVFDLPTVTLDLPIDLCTATGGGLPVGGVYSGAGVTDDGNGTTFTFDSVVAGPNIVTITYTFSDPNGCTDSATDTYQDITPPSIMCPADITVSNDPGQCDAVVTFMASATDSCPGTTIVYAPASGSTFPIGTTLVTATATDPSGNTASCSFDVTVNDTEPPVVTCVEFTTTFAGCPDVLGPNTPNGVWTPVGPAGGINSAVGGSFVFFLDLTTCVSDNCNSLANLEYTLVDSYEENRVPGCSVDLINEIAIRDVSGNVATTNVIFRGTIESGVTPPTIPCPADITVNNDLGVCGAAVTYATPVGTDTCGATTTVQTAGFASGATFPVGTTTNTFVATDGCGNTATCSFDVTVNDTEPPVAACMDFTVQLDAAGNGNIVASDVDGGSSDNCGMPLLSVSPSTFTCADVGPNPVILTVTDVNGNSSTCTATVTVEDNVPPVAICQDITVQLDATGNVSITGAAIDGGSTDACGIDTLVASPNAFTCADVGANTVTLTVTDVNGNSSQCTATVTVEDNIAPLMNCPADFTVGTDIGICGATVSFADPIALDNCGVLSVVQTAGLPSGSVFPVGPSLIEYTATDVNGNTTTCNFTVTVVDDEAPMAVCMDITIQLDAAGNATIVPADVDGGSTDNCAVATLSIDIDTFSCADVGPNNVVLTVTDTAGLMSSCTAIVTVEDITPPTAVCQDITVFLDETGIVTIDPSLLDGGSTDACGTANFTYTATPDTFTCAEVGDNTVTLTVTDENGNSATCEATVTVEDNIAPALVCQDITVELDENGMVSILPEDVIASLTDACGIDATGLDIDDFSCDDIGTPVTVNVFANDVNGNIVTCTATVTVVDVLEPQFDAGTLPGDQVRTADENGEYILEDFTTDVIVTDNCSILDAAIVLGQDPAVGTVLTVGIYDITLSAEDDFGNIAEYVFELEVVKPLGIGENSFDIASLTMYPNPATGFVLLSNPQNIPLKDVSIYDVTGRLIKTLDASQITSEMTIDISELASAAYMVLINTEAGQVTKQLIKE